MKFSVDKSLSCCAASTLLVFSLILVARCNAQEQARSADSFVESVGINGTSADEDAASFDLIHNYGFRYVRGNLQNLNDLTLAANINEAHAKYGIKIMFLVSQLDSPAVNVENLHNISLDAIDSIEGPNEVDGAPYGIGNAAAPGYQETLYGLIKSDPVYKSVPVVNFTVNDEVGQPTSDANDFANVHWYGFYDVNHAFLPPAESPYGSGAYGSIAYAIKKAELGITTPPKPVIMSEAGYFTGTGNDISRLGQAKYEPMMLATNFNLGIVRTYIYSLLDYDQSNQGLFIDGQPAGAAIKNLLAVLAEPGASFKPGSLSYTMNASGGNIKHTLLEKSNGDFYLLLWNEVAVYDPRASPRDLYNAPINTTLKISQPIAAADVYTQNNDGSYNQTIANVTDGSLTVAVPDSVTVVHLHTASATLPTAPPTEDGKTYIFLNRASGLVLDDPGLSMVPGTSLIQWSRNGGANQRWTLHDTGNRYFSVQNEQSGLCLDDENFGTIAGTAAQQWSCWNTDAQNWRITSDADGYVTLINQHSGLVLDDAHASAAPGNQIWLWTPNGTSAQNWLLEQP